MPGKDKEKIEKLRSLKPARYENLNLDYLVLYVMSKLQEIGADLSFENAIVAAFKIFPNKFSLLGYGEYPDGKRVHDSLFRCTHDKQWLGGKTRQGFVITERSRVFIKEAKDLLAGRKTKKTKAASKTRRKEVLVKEALETPAYIKFKERKKDSITEGDICYLLQGTLDTPKDILSKNYLSLKSFATELGEKELRKFLDFIEERFGYFLNLNNG